MEYMSEAYEALIAKLKEDNKDLRAELDEALFSDVDTIRCLWDFIAARHSPKDCLELAKQIDVVNENPEDMVQYILDRYPAIDAQVGKEYPL